MTIFISDAGRTKAKKAKISLNNDAKMSNPPLFHFLVQK